MLKWLKDFFFGIEEKKPLPPKLGTMPVEKKKPGRRPGIKTRKTVKK